MTKCWGKKDHQWTGEVQTVSENGDQSERAHRLKRNSLSAAQEMNITH